MRIVLSPSRLKAVIATLVIAGFSTAAQAGYKDQACTNCTAERHVDVQVIHKPRPRMLHIPDLGPRKRVRVHYHHHYQQPQNPDVQIIDRRQPLTKENHQRAQIILPQARPLSEIRNGIASGLSRIIGR